ncbi:GTP cyclohydrolase I [Pseudomonas sp. MDT1-16]|uniref:GTP cyclohydrolase I n=1 Tax=Pseudomonas sp. AL03 TaxID=3042230 RepID=UPI00249C7C2F|nr:GTP cyclohydrolase I [Pseudomonas sp. AL03]MDI3273697.1 GTP cyclohydrolase I [Pseudomonas sp. AL03]
MNPWLAEHYREILVGVGENPEREGLLGTPKRAAKAMRYLCNGKAHVAYLPTGRVLGLSKVARVVDMFARRLQIQENLTKQIADAIQHITDAAGVAVVIEAKHMCMMMRGVEKQNSVMTSSVMLGAFHESSTTRQEFLQLIGCRH